VIWKTYGAIIDHATGLLTTEPVIFEYSRETGYYYKGFSHKGTYLEKVRQSGVSKEKNESGTYTVFLSKNKNEVKHWIEGVKATMNVLNWWSKI